MKIPKYMKTVTIPDHISPSERILMTTWMKENVGSRNVDWYVYSDNIVFYSEELLMLFRLRFGI